MTDDKCSSVASLQIGGREVGKIRCELHAGHASARTITQQVHGRPPRIIDRISPTPHRYTMEWREDGDPIDDDSDPGVEVDFGE